MFAECLRHFWDSVQLDVESQEGASMAKGVVVEGSGVAGTPGVWLPGVLPPEFGASVH